MRMLLVLSFENENITCYLKNFVRKEMKMKKKETRKRKRKVKKKKIETVGHERSCVYKISK